MFKEKIIETKAVCDYDTGEVIIEAAKTKILTRDDVPFRSVTDLKVSNDHEKPNKSSLTNSKDYIPIEKMVNMIFRTRSIAEIRQELETGVYDEDNEIECLDDPIEQMDLVDWIDEHERQIEKRTANAESEQSATQAPTPTSGEGEAQSEAVSADVAG